MRSVKQLSRVAVTGAAGQIAYSLLFRIASGQLLGEDQPLALHLLEIPEGLPGLRGVIMELEDCAFPLLKEVVFGTNPEEVFQDIDYAFLIGAKPRGPGMERKDLLLENSKIFVAQGQALGRQAKKDILVLVVGNPCNTNCWIAMKNAKGLDPMRFYAMTTLDEKRAKALLALKAKVPVEQVHKMVIWGNHSALQVPDFTKVLLQNRPIHEVIPDEAWLENVFIPAVQKRGAEVIAVRGKSSAASAANAALDAMRALIFPTPHGEWFSMGLLSDGNPYGIASDLIFSFPCITRKRAEIEIVGGLSWSPFVKEKISLVERELLDEKGMVEHLPMN